LRRLESSKERKRVMSSFGDWTIPPAAQPKLGDFGFDLDRTLGAVVGLRAKIPADAFTAEVLGTDRAGHGVLIDDRGVVLTIGYLITEAEAVWLTTVEGQAVPAHVLAYDQVTGFGLVQALGRLDLPPVPLGSSAAARVGDRVIVAGCGGRRRSVAARIVAKQEFAGYWEYLLDEAILTAPAHPNWGGTAVLDSEGTLIGIGSLHLQQAGSSGPLDLNMVVPIDLLKPILNDLLTSGRAARSERPWLGFYVTELEDGIGIAGLAEGAPAQRAGLRMGDRILAVAGKKVSDPAGLFRAIWSLGDAGVDVPLLMEREGDVFEVRIASVDRTKLLKAPRLH
jgi:S1-C subfamily serine protease